MWAVPTPISRHNMCQHLTREYVFHKHNRTSSTPGWLILTFGQFTFTPSPTSSILDSFTFVHYIYCSKGFSLRRSCHRRWLMRCRLRMQPLNIIIPILPPHPPLMRSPFPSHRGRLCSIYYNHYGQCRGRCPSSTQKNGQMWASVPTILRYIDYIV